MEHRFKIVFDKLEDSQNARDAQAREEQQVATLVTEVAILAPELDEIAELRRLSTELAAPEEKLFTTS